MIKIDEVTGLRWGEVVPGIELAENGLCRKRLSDGSYLLITTEQAQNEIMPYKSEINIQEILIFFEKNFIPKNWELMHIENDLSMRSPKKFTAEKKFSESLEKITSDDDATGDQGGKGSGKPPATAQMKPHPEKNSESKNLIELQDEITELKEQLAANKSEVKRPRPE
jgi:hypothetical protein